MRTTVDIQDEVLRQAKFAAATSGITLSALVSDALWRALALRDSPRQPVHLPVYVPKILGMFPGLDITDNECFRAFLEEERDAELVALLNEDRGADS